jgi:hypothetical protein
VAVTINLFSALEILPLLLQDCLPSGAPILPHLLYYRALSQAFSWTSPMQSKDNFGLIIFDFK